MSLSLDAIASRLAAFLARETGGDVRVERLRHLAGGASRAAIAFDATIQGGHGAGEHHCVLRLDLGGQIYETSLSRAEEFQVIALARAGGVPVPEPLWTSSDPAVLERPFLILERVEGETIGRRIVQLPELGGARRALPAQMGRALAFIHKLEARRAPYLPGPGDISAAQIVLDRSVQELDKVDGAHPGLEAGLAWLRRHRPTQEDRVLVHGDFRLGNMIVGPEGLRSVLDWEFSSVGDPHEDLAWPFVRDWRFGLDAKRFAGISDGEDFLTAYEAESGRRVDRARLAYWEVVGNFRWALGCLTQAHRHLSGAEPSVELASLGRRSGEMQLEMLDLIDHISKR